MAKIYLKIVNSTSSTIQLKGELNLEFLSPDPVSGYYFGKINNKVYTGSTRIENHLKFSDGFSVSAGATTLEFTTAEYTCTAYNQKGDSEDWDGKRHLANLNTPIKSRHYISGADLYRSDGTGLYDINYTVTITPQTSSDSTNNTVCIADNHHYTFTITVGNNKVGGNSGGGDNPGGGGGETPSGGKEYDPYTNVPEINASGWESYGKGKRAELMYASVIPSCTDECFYTTKYFMFGGATENEVELNYLLKGEWSTTKSRRYVFYEITESAYNSHSSDPDYYKIDSVFGGLQIGNTDFVSPGASGVNGTLLGKLFLGTTSYPKYLKGNIVKNTVYRILTIAQDVGDSSGRLPTYGLNYGRVRPLGNTEHPNKTKRKEAEPQVGSPWNAFSNNTLKARFASKYTGSEYAAMGGDNYNFISALGSDELHGDGPTSWPSGHSSQCWAMAMTVVQLYGLKYYNTSSGKSAIIDEVCRYVHKAYKFGTLRTVGRFHWNSDTLYGKVFGSLIMPILNSSYDDSSGAPESFNELFDSAAAELFGGSLSRITSFTAADTSHAWYNDFLTTVNTIISKSGVNITLSTNLTNYLWYMYKAGRTEVESNDKVFNFFSNSCTNFYPNNNDSQYYDATGWTGCRAWFPEVFTGPRSLKLLKDGGTTSITYHGSNTTYNVEGVTNVGILCSWLMAFCLSELYISSAGSKSPSNLTKIFEAAYDIGGGRALNVYNEYAVTHDPMYLRLAAGIIYCFNRGLFGNSLINEIRSGTRVVLDEDTSNIIEPSEADTAVGNDVGKDLRAELNAWEAATIKYGIDNYYIFPNAPGPYVAGRKFSKPYEYTSDKPGSKLFQDISQFIVPGKKSNSSDTKLYESYNLNSPLITKDIVLKGNSLGEYSYSVGLLSDIHMNATSDPYYGEDDLKLALKVFTSEYKEKCDKTIQFICACGDIMESYHSTDNPLNDALNFSEIYNANANGLKLFTPLGDHDFAGIFNSRAEDDGHRDATRSNTQLGVGYNENVNERLNNIWYQYILSSNIVGSDIHYFRYNNYIDNDDLSGWDDDSGGVLNNYSKLNYWFEENNDIYIIMSIDYGNDTGEITSLLHDRMIKPRVIVDYSVNDRYITAMRDYVGNSYINNDKLFDYLFYHPNVLIWLKEIIENNTDKKIFVFTHHFLPHKTGNSVRVPSDTLTVNEEQIHPWVYGTAGDVLSGIDFRFINKLNNEHTNVVFFSGHSHLTWTNMNDSDTEGTSNINSNKFKNAHIDNHEYNIVSPEANAELAYTKSSSTSTGTSGYCVTLPSLTEPISPNYTGDWGESTLGENCDITIMDVYENGIKIKGWSLVKIIEETPEEEEEEEEPEVTE